MIRIVSSTVRDATFDGNEADPIKPAEIEHSVDELWADERRQELMQRYNYLDYHFEQDGGYCRARAYLDDPRKVTLFGPFQARGSLDPADAPEFEDRVLRYLRRRFKTVKRLQDPSR
jgi:hypothetical protein